MNITPLSHHPEYIATLAALHLPQWQFSHRGWTQHDWENEFRRHLTDLPCTLLALNAESELLGSASLVADDMNGTAPYSPWLANVLVLPAARGAGVGAALISAIEKRNEVLGHPALHLFTEDQQRFYERRGWQHIEQRHHEGKPVSIMRKSCRQKQSS